jgi:hypothetical protein
MAPASANSMAAAKPIARTADMNRIEDDAPRMGNYESGPAAVVKVAIRTSLSQDFATTEAAGACFIEVFGYRDPGARREIDRVR